MIPLTFPRARIVALLAVPILSVLAQGQTLTVSADRADALYKTDESIVWTIETSNSAALTQPAYTIKRGGYTTVSTGTLQFAQNRATVTTPASSPDSFLIEVTAKGTGGASLKAASGVVVSPYDIPAGAPKPSDFDTFWAGKLADLATVPVAADIIAGASGRSDVSYGTIRINGYAGTSVRGQWARPSAEGKYPGLVIFQWAGIYSLDKNWVLGYGASGWLTLNVQAHDINPIDVASYYTNLSNTTLSNYWWQGNDDKDASYYVRMYLACHRAVEYLSTRSDWDGKTIVVMGASQGGQQSIVAAALNPKVTGLIAVVPAGCDQDGIDLGRQAGFPSWSQSAWGRDLAKVRIAARYFDPINFADRIQCPAVLGVGFLDTTVPPPGVFLVYDRIKGPRRIHMMPKAEHSAGQESWQPIQTQWLNELKQGKVPVQSAAPLSAFSPVVTGRPINLSVRAGAGSGDNTLIGGFSLMGAGSKTLLIRAAGPSLAQFNIPSPLADPKLRVYNKEETLLAENDNWSLADLPYMKNANAFDWTTGSKDAALVVTLPAGNYTAQVVNPADGAPEALLEFYDLSQEASPYLYNVSSRIRQDTSQPTIVGVTLDSPVPVLLRNGGPSLSQFSIGSRAMDTTLQVFQGSTVILENDNWSPDLAAEFARLGAYGYGTSTADAAVRMAPPPSQITVHARAKGAAGVGLVEAFLAK